MSTKGTKKKGGGGNPPCRHLRSQPVSGPLHDSFKSVKPGQTKHGEKARLGSSEMQGSVTHVLPLSSKAQEHTNTIGGCCCCRRCCCCCCFPCHVLHETRFSVTRPSQFRGAPPIPTDFHQRRLFVRKRYLLFLIKAHVL